MTMARCCRILALSAVAALAVDCAVAYVFLIWGPFPEDAW